jgi:hypothetical protein
MTLEPARVRVTTGHLGPPRGRGSQGAREGMGSGAWATGRGEVRGSDLVPADCSQSGFAQGWVATHLHGVAGLGEALCDETVSNQWRGTSEAVPAPSPAWGECLEPPADCPLPCRQPRVKRRVRRPPVRGRRCTAPSDETLSGQGSGEGRPASVGGDKRGAPALPPTLGPCPLPCRQPMVGE